METLIDSAAYGFHLKKAVKLVLLIKFQRRLREGSVARSLPLLLHP